MFDNLGEIRCASILPSTAALSRTSFVNTSFAHFCAEGWGDLPEGGGEDTIHKLKTNESPTVYVWQGMCGMPAIHPAASEDGRRRPAIGLRKYGCARS